MNESKQRKIGAIFSYITIILNTVIQLVYTPFLIRMMGQQEYGLYSLVYSIIGYLSILDLGFGNAIIVFATKYRIQKKYEEEKKLLGMFSIIYKIIGIIAFFIGIILFFNTNNIFASSMTCEEIEKMKIMMIILSINLFITFSFTIYSSLLTSYEKFTYQKLMVILNTILKPLIMIPMLFLGYKSIALCIIITILNFLTMFSNYLYCRIKLKIKIKFTGFDKRILKVILLYSFWIFLTTVVDKVNWSVDQTILGIINGTVAVSIYSVATHFNTMFVNLSTAISGVLLPKVTKMVANNVGKEELTNEFIKIGRIQFYIMFLMTTGFILVGKQFIIWWVGEEFIQSYYVTLLLVLPASFVLIQNVGVSIMQAMDKYKFKAVATFIMAIFNVLISIFLAKKFGPIGAASGTTIAIIICNIIIMNIYYYKVIKIDIIKFWKSIFCMILKMMIPIIIVVVIMKLTNLEGIISVALYGGIYTVLYGITAIVFVINDYEKNLIKSFLNKLKIVKE